MAQRLVRTMCKKCRTPFEPTESQPLFQERIYGPATRIVPPYVERILAGEVI